MADRRRRKCTIGNTSDCASDESADEQLIQHCSNPGSDVGNSEYESVEEEELCDEDEVQDEEVANILNGPADAQDEKPLDHDEDRKNPQYIPKRGTFYEHDDRTMGEDDAGDSGSEKPPASEKELKKVWKEDGKWTHDRFSVYDQSPKSRDELVATYGYDIRNEEGPPRARRRRRYGRGPNKYTRNWEDVEAYSKPTRGRVATRVGKEKGRRKTPRSEEEFPPLPIQDEEVVEAQEMHMHTVETLQVEPSKGPRLPVTPPNQSEITKGIRGGSPPGRTVEELNKYLSGSRRGGRPPNRKGRPPSKGHPGVLGFIESGHHPVRIRGENMRGREGKVRGSGRGGHTQSQTSPHLQKEIQEVTEELKSITISASHKEEHHFKNKRGIDTRRSTIPPRLQETMKVSKSPSNAAAADSNSVSKPKRYSSQRQRPLQDQVGGYHSAQPYFDQNSSDSGYSSKIYERPNSSPGTLPPSQLSLAGQAPPTFVAPSFTTTATTYPGPRLFPPATQRHLIGPSVPGPPIGGPPPVAVPPVPGPVGAPAVTGQPFLPPENMINYAAGAPALVAPPHATQFPSFQPFTPVSQQQPAEIYSNGVMYYNTQSQQHLPRINSVLLKRPKAAIPIVPPPDNSEMDAELRPENDDDIDSAAEFYDYDLNEEGQEVVPGELSGVPLLEMSENTDHEQDSDCPDIPAADRHTATSDKSVRTEAEERPSSKDELSPDVVGPDMQTATPAETGLNRLLEQNGADSSGVTIESPSPVADSGDDHSPFLNGDPVAGSPQTEADESAQKPETTTAMLEDSETKSSSITDLSKSKQITEPAAVTT